MPNPEDMEPISVYRQRQQTLEQRRTQWFTTEQQKQAQPEEGNILMRGLSLLGRPLSAVSTGLSELVAGRPEQIPSGIWRGLSGESEIKGIEPVLQQMGVPELGGVQTPFGRLTGRGMIGAAGNLFADPLSYVLPWGKPWQLAGKGAAGVATKGAIAPSVEAISQQMFRPTTFGRVAQKAAKLPVVGKPLEGIMARISPKLVADTPIKKLIIAYDDDIGHIIPNQVNSKVAQLAAQQPEQIMPLTKYGEMALTDGRKVAWTDAAAFPGKYAITPAQKGLFDSWKATWKPLFDYGKKIGVKWEEYTLGVGEEFFTRLWREQVQGAMPRWMAKATRARGVEKAHVFKSAEQGLAAFRDVEARGMFNKAFDVLTAAEKEQVLSSPSLKVLASPLETFKVKLTEIHQAIANQELSNALEPFAQRIKPKAARIAGLMETTEPGLKGMFFTPENAQLLTDKLTAEVSRRRAVWLKPFTDASALSRQMGASLDFAGGMLQGLPLLARSPGRWAQAQIEAARALWNPMNHQKLIAQPWFQALHQEMPNMVVSSGTREFFAAPPKIIGLIPGGKQMFGRAMAAFDAFGDAARGYSGLGLIDLARRQGKVWELGEFLNKMSGYHYTPGLSPLQKATEGSLLFFAPRYVRASLALVGDALTTGGFGGDQARRAIAAMMTSGVLMYIKGAMLLGQEPNLDPSKTNFLTVKVGNDNVGIGSIWVSLARLLGQTITEPEKIPTGDNPMIRWWRARAAPTGGALWDLMISNEDYVGRPLDNPVDIGKYLGTKFIPFALEAYILQNPKGELASFLPSIAGMRTYPQSFAERRDTMAQQMFPGKKYEELEPLEQAQVLETPEIKGMPEPAGKRGERTRATMTAFDQYRTGLEEAAQQVTSGEKSKGRFRAIEGTLANTRNAILSDIEQRLPSAAPYEAKDPRERARQEYLQYFREAKPWEEVPYEGAEEFLAALPKDTQDYIKEKQQADIQRLPDTAKGLMQGLWEARQLLQPYWAIREDVMKRLGLWDEWQGMTDVQRDEFTQTARYKRAQQRWQLQRKLLRRRDRATDDALIEWGYASVPIRQQGR